MAKPPSSRAAPPQASSGGDGGDGGEKKTCINEKCKHRNDANIRWKISKGEKNFPIRKGRRELDVDDARRPKNETPPPPRDRPGKRASKDVARGRPPAAASSLARRLFDWEYLKISLSRGHLRPSRWGMMTSTEFLSLCVSRKNTAHPDGDGRSLFQNNKQSFKARISVKRVTEPSKSCWRINSARCATAEQPTGAGTGRK